MIIKIDTHEKDFERLVIGKCRDKYEARIEINNDYGGITTNVLGFWSNEVGHHCHDRDVGFWSDETGHHCHDRDVHIDVVDSVPKRNVDKEIVDELIDDIKSGLLLDKDYQREELLCWIKCKRMRAEDVGY